MKAVILKRKDFGEYDQVISVYTQESGRLDVYARGVKKILSKNSSHLEPFALSELEVSRGRGWTKLIKASGYNFFTEIRSDFKKSFFASDAVNFLYGITREEQKEIRMFTLLENYLDFLNNPSSEISFATRYSFCLKCMAVLGFSLRTERENFSEEETFCFSPREGGFFDKQTETEECVFCSGKEASDFLALVVLDWPGLKNVSEGETVKEMCKKFIQFHLGIIN